MKYINKEYGFALRPPFLDSFYEESLKGPAVKANNFPGRYIIGAGLDYSAINGAILVGKEGSIWGVKVTYHNGIRWMENEDFIQNLSKDSIYNHDGSYAHFVSGPLSVKWIRHAEQGLGVQITASQRLRVRVTFYPCFAWPGEMSIEGSLVRGKAPYVATIPGEISLGEDCATIKKRYQVVLDEKTSSEYFVAQSYMKPLDFANGAFNEVMMEFIINNYQPNIFLYCAVGDEKVLALNVPRVDKLAKLIESTGDLKYSVNKCYGSGTLGQGIEKFLNFTMWSRIYNPYMLDTAYISKRLALDNHFNINGLGENTAALCAMYFGNGSSSEPQLKYTLEDRLFSVLTVHQVYAHIKEKSSLIKLYNKLSRLYPADDGELVIDNRKDKKDIAYRQSDSPLKEFNDLPMYSLDMSCIKLLAVDILERIALRFNLAESASYAQSKAKLIENINLTLWNENKGLYMNRYTNNEWPRSYGATSFYPLIAGAVNNPERLRALVDNLTDSKKFWGGYVIPTISKDNASYGKRGANNTEPYLQYRGAIVPYINYLIYQGLVRYGLDELAAEFAFRCVKLWNKYTKLNMTAYDRYLPSGKRVKGLEVISTEGALFGLIGLQELIDVEYFRDDLKSAIRFGTLVKGSHAVNNIKILGHNYSVSVDNYSTVLLMDNQEIFRAEGGRCVVRQFLLTKEGVTFFANAMTNVNVTINLTGLIDEFSSPKSFDLLAGKSKVRLLCGNLDIVPLVQKQ